MQHYQEPSNPTVKKRSILKKIGLFFLFTLLLILVGLVVTWFSFHRYLESNETKIFKELDFLSDGGVAFDKASISVFKNFPLATISLNNFVLQDALFDEHQIPLLQLGQLSATLSLHQLLAHHRIDIQSIHLQDGTFHMFRDSNDYRNLRAVIQRKTSTGQQVAKERNFKIETNGLELSLSNIDFNITRASTGMNIRGKAKNIQTKLSIDKETISLPIEMNTALNHMTLRGKEGAYLKNSTVVGTGLLKFKNGLIELENFDLDINEENFLMQGLVDTKAHDRLFLVLENQESRLDKITPLLPKGLQKDLSIFKIDYPFCSKTTIETFPKTGKQALATIEFDMQDNELKTANYQYNKVDLEGVFVNRMYDKTGIERTDVSHALSVTLKNVKANYKGFKIQTPHGLITSCKEQDVWIYTQLKASGRAARVSQLLENDQFFFKKGTFNATINIATQLAGYIDMAIASKMSLNMHNFSVYYEPADVAFPFHELTLAKEAGDANFRIVGGTFREGYNYIAKGGMQNFPALILDLVGEQAKSEVAFHAKKLGWVDFIDLFGENGYLSMEEIPKPKKAKTDHQKKASMKETLRGLHYDFQPSMSVAIDTLEYYGKLELRNFNTGVHFADANTIVLERTSFNYEEGEVSMQATLDISQTQRTPFEFELQASHINLQALLPSLNYFNVKLLSKLENPPKNVSINIKHKGILDDEKGLLPNTSTGEITFSIDDGETLSGLVIYESSRLSKQQKHSVVRTKIHLDGLPHLFNNFFKTEQFFFDKGRFNLEIEYEGDVKDFAEMLNKGKATFAVHDSQVYYKPGDVTFPINQIQLNLAQDKADFDLKIESDSLHQKINFTGNITNLSELVLGKTGKKLSTMAMISAPKLSWQEIQDYFINPNIDTIRTDSTKTMKATVIGIFETFDPNIHLRIDTFVYSKQLMVEELKTGLYLENEHTFVLDQTGFNFHDGSVYLDGKLKLHQGDNTPFHAHFKIDDLDAAGLLEALNYLSLPSLQNMKNLSGRVSLNLDLEGIINKEGTALLPEANKGILDFNVKDLHIEGLQPLDDIAAKIMMKKRFSTLRFAPISNVFEIIGTEIKMPMTEIQTNTVNLFVEGQLSYLDATDIWVSVPVYNFLLSDPDTLTDKSGYHHRPMKLHVAVSSDEEGKNQFDIRFKRKKFYTKERGGVEQYRKDKRAFRRLRKEERRK